MTHICVRDKTTRTVLGYLENATNVAYDLPMNSLWTASFQLPADDVKNNLCQQLNLVEIYDGDERIDLFYIIGSELIRGDEAFITYSCEHVLGTLLNDVIFGTLQIGGIGTYTLEVIQDVLGYQATANWAIADSDFSRQFEYCWQHENLLSALFSIPQCFDADYLWTWDTTVYPWQLSLKTPSNALKSEVRYAKNLTSIKKTVDSTSIANVIYALGYGEGDNQLTLRDSSGNVEYLQDQQSIFKYGRRKTILVDTRFENEDTLRAYAQSVLNEMKEPYITYEVGALDLTRLQKDIYAEYPSQNRHLPADFFSKFRPGEIVRVVDSEDNSSIRARITNVAKQDIFGNPGEVILTLANKSKDAASSISDLQNRALINETYAQGSTNLMVQTFADNSTSDFPITFKTFIPTEAVRINKVLLSLELDGFRGYSATASTVASSSSTSSSGGGTSTTQTSSDTTLTSSNTITSSDTGGSGGANHNHGVPHNVWIPYSETNGGATAGWKQWKASGAHEHPAHSHTVQIRTSSHTHTVTIPGHSHDMTYGIYTDSLNCTGVKIKVNSQTEITKTMSELDSIDITALLVNPQTGKIDRGTWHNIRITPYGGTAKAHITASLFTQVFNNSRGGGDF